MYGEFWGEFGKFGKFWKFFGEEQEQCTHHSHNETAHVLRRLAESVFETCNRGEDFRECDEAVWHGLNPDVDRAAAGIILADNTGAVDVDLNNAGRDHGSGCNHESHRNTLDGREANSGLAKSGIEEGVDQGDEEDQGQGVEVVDQIVGDCRKVLSVYEVFLAQGSVLTSTKIKSCRLGGQVVDHLVVSEPVQWQPEEDLASVESTGNLINPDIVEAGHPSGSVAAESTRLDAVPEVLMLEVAVSLDGVRGYAALACESEKLSSVAQNRASWWGGDIELLAAHQDEGSGEEHKRWQRVTQPESNVLLGVDHANATDETTGVDHHVEVEEDSAVGDLRVNDNALAGLWQCQDLWASLLDLFSEKRRNVRLETTSSQSHDDEPNSETTESTLFVVHDTGNRRHDEDSVSNKRGENTPLNGGVTTKVGIGNVSTDKRHQVSPELVERG